jgi:hypothetical protein
LLLAEGKKSNMLYHHPTHSAFFSLTDSMLRVNVSTAANTATILQTSKYI